MKKIIISSKNLKTALDKLGQAVPKKPALPVLSNILLRMGTNEVELLASDLELTIKYRVDCETQGQPFDVLLPYEFIRKIASLSKSVPVVISMEEKTAHIHVTNDEYQLNVLDQVENFPVLPALPKKNFVSLSGQFTYILSRALMTVSGDDLRPALTNVCLDIFSEGAKVVSTDAHSLFTQTLPVEANVEEKILLSPKIVKALEGFDTTEIYWNKKHIGFHSGDVTVIATRPDVQYPDYKGVIPTYEANLLVDREEVINALQRCCLTSNGFKETTLFLKEEKGTVRFIAEDQDFGRRIQVDISGAYDGPVDAISVSAARLLTLMNQVDFDKVNLHIHFSNRPIVISAENDPSFLSLLLPIAKS